MFAKIDMKRASVEEKKMFREMQVELRAHNNYNNKNKYYPFKMDEFDDIAKNIESSYREKIAEMQKQRFQKENEEEEKARCEERARLFCEATEGLLELSNPDRLQKKRKPVVPDRVRRSARFADVPSWSRGSRYMSAEEAGVL